MKKKSMQHSPLWRWSYDYPSLDKKVISLHRSMKELDGLLGEKLGKNKKKKGQ